MLSRTATSNKLYGALDSYAINPRFWQFEFHGEHNNCDMFICISLGVPSACHGPYIILMLLGSKHGIKGKCEYNIII